MKVGDMVRFLDYPEICTIEWIQGKVALISYSFGMTYTHENLLTVVKIEL